MPRTPSAIRLGYGNLVKPLSQIYCSVNEIKNRIDHRLSKSKLWTTVSWHAFSQLSDPHYRSNNIYWCWLLYVNWKSSSSKRPPLLSPVCSGLVCQMPMSWKTELYYTYVTGRSILNLITVCSDLLADLGRTPGVVPLSLTPGLRFPPPIA